MKLYELHYETLKLMDVDYENDFNYDSVNDYLELLNIDNYSKYLRAMNGAINRCFGRIRQTGKQGTKSVEIELINIGGIYGYYDLKDIEDYDFLERVIFIDKYGEREDNAEYTLQEKNKLVLKNQEGTYILVYYPRMPYVYDRLPKDPDKLDTLLNTEFDLDEDILRIIPYFIKGDLYEEDEPELAYKSRQLFETYLAQIRDNEPSTQTKVKDVLY